MSGKVVLRIKQGEEAGKEFVFRDHTLCTVGRAGSCALQFASPDVSRRHCLLDIDPPLVRVRDLGSRNGTYVNGEKIGQRTADEQADTKLPEIDLYAGDEIRFGSEVLEVAVYEPRNQPVINLVAEKALFA